MAGSPIIDAKAEAIGRQLEIMTSTELGSAEAIDAVARAVQLVMTVAKPHLVRRYPIPDQANDEAERKMRRQQLADILCFVERSMMLPAGDSEFGFASGELSTPPAMVAGALSIELRLLNFGIQSSDFQRETASNSGATAELLAAKSIAVKTADWLRSEVGNQAAYEAELKECKTSRTAINRFRKSVAGTPFPEIVPDFRFPDIRAATAHLSAIVTRVKALDSCK